MGKVFFLADDDLDDQDMFIEAVKALDKHHDVVSAFDGQEAMQLLSGGMDKMPDFIFLDLNMPKLNGKQCLERIRQMQSANTVPVFIYSTSSFAKDMEETAQLGAAKFITKPSSFGKLQNVLAEIVEADWSR